MTKPLKTLKVFDPIDFLGIHEVRKSERENLRKKLEVNITEYILIRLLDELPDKIDEQLKKKRVENVDDLERLLKSHIPDFDQKVAKYLEEFKKQYQNE